jgi:hypothetical protein
MAANASKFYSTYQHLDFLHRSLDTRYKTLSQMRMEIQAPSTQLHHNASSQSLPKELPWKDLARVSRFWPNTPTLQHSIVLRSLA